MITAITTEAEYEKALLRVDELFDAPTGSPEEKELCELVNIIVDWEDAQGWLDMDEKDDDE